MPTLKVIRTLFVLLSIKLISETPCY